MSRALALETSGRVGSVALARDGKELVEEQYPHGLKHAAGIVPIIDRLCRGQGWGPWDIDGIHASVGPGSFTGLRVGVTVAKALAFATGARLVAVPAPEATGRDLRSGWKNAVVVLDAKRGQIFTTIYANVEGRRFVVEGPRLDDLRSVLARTARPVHLLGEGIPYHREAIPVVDSDVIVLRSELWQARARAVVEVGGELARRGEFTHPPKPGPGFLPGTRSGEKT